MKRIFDPKDETASRENVYYWMNKYITLLEKYNELLLQLASSEVQREDPSGQGEEDQTTAWKEKAEGV